MLDELKTLVRDVEEVNGLFRCGEDGVLDREGSLLRSWEHATEDEVTQYFLASLLMIDLGNVLEEPVVHTFVPAAERLPALHYVRVPALSVDVHAVDVFSAHLKAWLEIRERRTYSPHPDRRIA